jgi:divalent metal cation (Fe/Co/Zn/Cd) transporter
MHPLYFRNSICYWVLCLPLPLVERSKEEIARAIRRKVERLRGVKGCSQLSVRAIGKTFDVSMRVLLDGNLRFGDPHKIALNIEKEVKSVIPNSRVSIDTEPFGNDRGNVWRFVKETAEATPGSRGVHNIHIQKIDGKLCIDLHLEVSANMTVKQAHDVADDIERKIKAADLDISDVTVHIESASDRISRELAGVETELESFIEDLAKSFPEIKNVYGIKIRKFGDVTHIALQCQFDPKLTINKAHEIAGKLEKEIKTAYPKIERIDIHEEPA